MTSRPAQLPPAAAQALDRARAVSDGVLARWAAAVDAEDRFPHESVAALRDAGLLGYFVPPELGGLGGDVQTYCRIAEALGQACLSTAIIWVMHAHQTAVLADHRTPAHEPYLREIAARGVLLASVTSEYGKGGDVLRAEAPLHREGLRLRVRRRAPTVSYGAQAGFFLVTMRAGEDRPPTDVSLVLVRPEDGSVAVTGRWEAMGLRGTASAPMAFDVAVEPHRVVGRSFREVALKTLVPAAHAGWAAAWFGAAKGALARFVRAQRERRTRDLNADLFLTRLAELRLQLDLLDSLLVRVARRLDALRAQDAPMASYEDLGHNILVNNLKVAGSRLAFAVADGLIELGGLGYGYLRSDPSGIERVFRDLRSAALMYHNDRLLQANGRLILVEDQPVSNIWAPDGNAG
jgi:alkylation response protein AidB-like acyl-CoA dehydrogenase